MQQQYKASHGVIARFNVLVSMVFVLHAPFTQCTRQRDGFCSVAGQSCVERNVCIAVSLVLYCSLQADGNMTY